MELTKRCSKCKETKSAAEFSKDRYRGDGRSIHCKFCRSNINHNSYRNHVPNAERKGQQTGTFDRNTYSKQYRQKNLARYAQLAAKRKARKLQATPKWADFDAIQKIYERAKELELETGDKYHVDHFIPLQSELVCGLHCEVNLQILLSEENLRKSNSFTF